MNENKLTSYNFLATLTENGQDLYTTVYIPICKRALSKFSQKGKEYGSDIDIQNEIHDLYGLNVPITVVRQLINASAKNFSRKEKQETSIEIYENGKSFKLKFFSFNRLEKIYNQLANDSAVSIRPGTYCQSLFVRLFSPEFLGLSFRNSNVL